MIDPNGIERDLGQDRIQLMWPFRRFLDAGVTLAFGTDSPVVEINPFNGLYNAVTRRSAFDGKPDGGWIPAERINVYEAVSATPMVPPAQPTAQTRSAPSHPANSQISAFLTTTFLRASRK